MKLAEMLRGSLQRIWLILYLVREYRSSTAIAWHRKRERAIVAMCYAGISASFCSHASWTCLFLLFFMQYYKALSVAKLYRDYGSICELDGTEGKTSWCNRGMIPFLVWRDSGRAGKVPKLVQAVFRSGFEPNTSWILIQRACSIFFPS